ncbi:putative ribonuclease III [Helianthus annuus]|uniref:Ribonuclease III n=1 Tax=Helianthus annuus TaxID=4232 RepID=A0A9K3E9A1_HELAN|nr:putative ribonuclease III [Helianthus annuus]KAJ0840580.1 putative ribonuclease III [Helianthus annuus]
MVKRRKITDLTLDSWNNFVKLGFCTGFSVVCFYQIEALAQAIKENTIVFLETGSGKTLIAIMLLCHYAYLLKKSSSCIAVFLVVGTHCCIGQTISGVCEKAP